MWRHRGPETAGVDAAEGIRARHDLKVGMEVEEVRGRMAQAKHRLAEHERERRNSNGEPHLDGGSDGSSRAVGPRHECGRKECVRREEDDRRGRNEREEPHRVSARKAAEDPRDVGVVKEEADGQ